MGCGGFEPKGVGVAVAADVFSSGAVGIMACGWRETLVEGNGQKLSGTASVPRVGRCAILREHLIDEVGNPG